MRYLYSVEDNPQEDDYFYEVTKTTNYHFPRLSSHSHSYYEIYVFLAGDIRLKIGDEIHNVLQGDIIVMPPRVSHQLLPANDNYDIIYDRIYMYITIPCLKSFDFNSESLFTPIKKATENSCYHFHMKDNQDYNQILNCMLDIYQSKKHNHPAKEMLNRASIQKMMALLGANITERLAELNGAISNPLIDQIASYINEHYQENFTLEQLAAKFYVNKNTLSKHFKKQFAMTIHDYHIAKRIEKAKEKLLTGGSPTEVSQEVGFGDYSSFYRTFQKKEGISPKDFIKTI